MDTRSDRTKKSLAEVMFALLEQKDFDAITVGGICDQAGISRATFYLHFEDKYSLALHCVRDVVLSGYSRLEHGDLDGYVEAMLRGIYERRRVFRRLIRHSESRELRFRADKLFQSICQRYYLQLQEQGVAFDVPAEIAALYHCAGIRKLVERWIANDFAEKMQTVKRHIISLHEASLVRALDQPCPVAAR